MNWRNPFLNAYLAVTVVGAGALGYFLYTSYSHYTEVSTNYDTQVAQLQKLQNKVPFPSEENNRAYAALTTQYRGEYEKLLAQVAKMQKPIEAITPQTFQDRLRTYVSEVMAAAKLNGIGVDDSFYLGFDQYRDQLPSNESAGVLARELDAVRLVVDQLIGFKVREIRGVKRELLPEEGGNRRQEAASAPQTSRQRPGGGGGNGGGGNAPRIVSANSFDVSFVSDQSRLRQVLNAIVTAKQFFIIRNLSIENSALEGPKRVDPAAANAVGGPTAGASADPGTPPVASMRLLVGRETLVTVLRIEMITFTPPDSKK